MRSYNHQFECGHGKQADGNQALTVVQFTMDNTLVPFLNPVLIEMYISRGAWYTEVLPAVGSYGELYKRVFVHLVFLYFLP